MQNKAELKKLIESYVFRTLLEFKSTFRWDKFKQQEGVIEQLTYAKTNLPMLGFGSSRVGFALPNTKYVLKVARSAKGIAQNKNEVEVFTSPVNSKIIAKVFDSASDYSWIVAETVKEFPDNESGRSQFLDHTGLSFSITEKIIGLIGDYKGAWKDNLGKAFARNSQVFPMIEKKYVPNPFFAAVESLMVQKGLSAGDLTKVEHWGKTADGRVVLLDYGLTREIWKNHYAKPEPQKAQPQAAANNDERTVPSKPSNQPADERTVPSKKSPNLANNQNNQ